MNYIVLVNLKQKLHFYCCLKYIFNLKEASETDKVLKKENLWIFQNNGIKKITTTNILYSLY